MVDINNNNNNNDKIKIIISLDGGGTRGYFTVLMIESLFRAAGIDVFEHADLFGGTSTGGIIALAKAMGKICNEELANVYRGEEAINLFNISHAIYNLLRDQSLVSLKEYVKLITDTLTKEGKEKENLTPNGRQKQCFVVSLVKEHDIKPTNFNVDENTEKNMKRDYKPVLIANYNENKSNSNEDKFQLAKFYTMCDNFNAVKAIRATSAIPLVFQSPCDNGNQFYDGGIKFNNPVGFAYYEARKMFPKNKLLILSFGTGIEKKYKEDYEKILESNNSTTKVLDQHLNKPNSIDQKGTGIFESISNKFLALLNFPSNFSDCLTLKFTNEANQESGYQQFKDVVGMIENDPNVYFYRFDNLLKNEISGELVDIEFHDTNSFDILRNSGVSLRTNKDAHLFFDWAQTIKNVINHNNNSANFGETYIPKKI